MIACRSGVFRAFSHWSAPNFLSLCEKDWAKQKENCSNLLWLSPSSGSDRADEFLNVCTVPKLDLRKKKKKKFSSFLESHFVCFVFSLPLCQRKGKKLSQGSSLWWIRIAGSISHNNVVPSSLYRVNIINNLALNSGLKFLLRDKSHIFIRSGLYSISFMMCSHHWIHHSPGSLLCQSVRMRNLLFILALISARFVPYVVCRVIPRRLVNLICWLCFPRVINHTWSVFIFPESSSLVFQTDFIHPTRGMLVLVVSLCNINCRSLGCTFGP